jgi:uncharacterized protein
MLKTVHLRPDTYRKVPWKNGQGTSLEIAVHPGTPYLWRVTQAPLLHPGGPFSTYPGYHRNLVILKGGPVTVVHQTDAGTRSRVLTPRQAYPFPGEWKTEAIVESNAKDLNIFTLNGKASAKVYPISMHTGEHLQFPISGQEHFIYCATGTMEILEQNTGETYLLQSNETLWASRQGKKEFLNLRAHATSIDTSCVWIVIHL